MHFTQISLEDLARAMQRPTARRRGRTRGGRENGVHADEEEGLDEDGLVVNENSFMLPQSPQAAVCAEINEEI